MPRNRKALANVRPLRAIAWPSPDEAQDLLDKELSNPRYQAPEPTWWDKLVSSVVDFFQDLLSSVTSDAVGPIIVWIVAGVIVVLIVAAFFIWGRPRFTITSRATPDALFGDDDPRTADQLRAAADGAAHAGDWNQAVILRMRALARGLDERGIVVLAPGATVQQFAHEASRSFPGYVEQVSLGARIFDNVRYVRVNATRGDYNALTALDTDLQRSRAQALSTLPSLAVPS